MKNVGESEKFKKKKSKEIKRIIVKQKKELKKRIKENKDRESLKKKNKEFFFIRLSMYR